MAMIRLIPRAGKRQEMIDIFSCVESEARLRFGCASSCVFEQVSPGQAILYMENWLSEEELHRHIRSGLYHWILAAMELSGEPPEICFHRISDTKGLDMIESLRGSKQDAG